MGGSASRSSHSLSSENEDIGVIRNYGDHSATSKIDLNANGYQPNQTRNRYAPFCKTDFSKSSANGGDVVIARATSAGQGAFPWKQRSNAPLTETKKKERTVLMKLVHRLAGKMEARRIVLDDVENNNSSARQLGELKSKSYGLRPSASVLPVCRKPVSTIAYAEDPIKEAGSQNNAYDWIKKTAGMRIRSTSNTGPNLNLHDDVIIKPPQPLTLRDISTQIRHVKSNGAASQQNNNLSSQYSNLLKHTGGARGDLNCSIVLPASASTATAPSATTTTAITHRRTIQVQASSTELIACVGKFLEERCFRLRHFNGAEAVAWMRNADRSLLALGWQDVPFINPANIVFVFMLLRETVDSNVVTAHELHNLVLTCLYLSFSYMGNEISYPLKPFLAAPDLDRQRFWTRCLKIVAETSAKMLRINSDPTYFTQLFRELKVYSCKEDANGAGVIPAAAP